MPTTTAAESLSSVHPIQLSWEADVDARIREALLNRIIEKAQEHEEQQEKDKILKDAPYMIACVGIPGSGKTTSSSLLMERLSDLGCLIMPFDGYHYPLATLQTWPNAKDAIYRRGAVDTFDSKSLLRDLERIRFGKEPEIVIPGFDHAKGDPHDGAHTFQRDKHRVVICEGLYLLHDADGWEKLKEMFDYSVFVEADLDACMNRLKIRNKCIPGYTPEEIEIRVDAVDRVNAMQVQASKSRADLVVKSIAF